MTRPRPATLTGDLYTSAGAAPFPAVVLLHGCSGTEPLPRDHPFWVTPGITVLPHIGGLHPERDHIVARLWVENLRRFLDGQPLLETVDRARGY